MITEQATLRYQDFYFGEAVFNFSDFDAQLGILTGVSVAVTYYAGDSFMLESHAIGPLVGYFNTYASVNMAGIGQGLLPSPQSVPENLEFGGPPQGPFYDFNATLEFGGSATFNVAQWALLSYETPPNSPALPDEIDLYAQPSMAPGQAFVFAVDPHLNETYASIAITYTYDPVPEPTSLALFSVGILGVFAASRRGRARYSC